SLTDTGNWYATVGNPGPPYYQGHFSNGPIWVERLASRLGVPAPRPSLLGGSNNAYAGAETGTGASPRGGGPNIRTQAANWLSGHTPGPGDLIVVMGGAVDFALDGQTDPSVPVANLRAAVTDLASKGGRRFVVANLYQLGYLPLFQPQSQPQRDALNLLT